MKVEFEYMLGQDVVVVAIGMKGKIDSMSLDVNGKMYRVVYWNNGKRESTWVYDWEVKP